MAIVPVQINGKQYHLACDNGQEEQLVALSQEVDDRVQLLARQVPHASEGMLLLMVAVMLTDELADAKRTSRQMQGELNELRHTAAYSTSPSDQARLMEMEAAMAATLQDVAQRIEKIAEQLDNNQ